MAQTFKYGLYLMSYDEYYMGSVLKQYILDLKRHSRRVTVGFSFIDILKEVAEENTTDGDEQQKPNKKSDNDFIYGKYTKTHMDYPAILSKMVEKIEYYLQEGKLDKLDVESAEEFNILDYWSQNPTAGKVTSVGQAAGGKSATKSGGASSKAASSKAASSKPPSKSSKSKISKRTSVSTQQTRSIRCELGPIVPVNLIEKQSSKMTEKKNEPKSFIEDHPIDNVELYIVLIGNFGPDIIFELIAKGYPLSAIAYVYAKNIESPDFENYAQRERDILFKSSKTKDVGFYDLHVTPLPCYLTTRFSKQVYDELAWFLYDTELQRDRRDNFLDHIEESDVSDDRGCDKVRVSYEPDFPQISTFSVTCLLYFERFLNAFNTPADEAFPLKSHHPSLNWCSETPYIDITDKYRLLEETNMILRMHLKSELDLSFYYSAMDTFRKMYNLSKIWNINAFETPRMSVDAISNNSMFIFDNYGIPEYAEPLTTNSIVQRFEELRQEYDSIYYIFNASERDVIITLTSTRRPFYEKTDKVLLPTKVCYRDFTEFVIPEMQDWLRWQDDIKNSAENESNLKQAPNNPQIIEDDFTISNNDFIRHVSLKQKKLDAYSEGETNMSFSEQTVHSNLEDSEMYDKYKQYFKGFNLGDTRKELNSTTAVYRSRSVTLRVVKDMWINGDKTLTLDIMMLTYRILLHRRIPLKTDNPGLRIMSIDLWSFEYEHVLGSSESPDDAISLINVSWPTGMDFECIFKEKTAEIIHIKQAYNNRDREEEKRIYYSDGTMIIFYPNNSVQIWRANGTLYHTTNTTSTDQSVNKTYDEFSENATEGSTFFTDMQHKYAFEMEYIQKYRDIVDADNFTLVTTEGYRYEIKYGRVVGSFERYLIAEWYDWMIEENYTLREDELMILNRTNYTLTYFPNGTFVKTCITDSTLHWYIDQDEREFLSDVPTYANSSENVTNSLIDEFVALSSEDLYITCDRTYLMQHEKFITCHFMKENTVLISPCGLTTKINLEGVIINLKRGMDFHCNKNQCHFTSPEEEKSLIFGESFAANTQIGSAVDAKLIYAPKDGEPLFELSELIGHVCINKDFTWDMQDSYQRSTKRVCEIRLEIGLDGFELQSEQDIYEYVSKIDREDAIIDVNDDVITILTPIYKFCEMFILPIRDLPEFLIKFYGKEFECTKAQKSDKKKTPTCLTIKCFYKLERFKKSVFTSQLNYFVMRTSFGSQLNSVFTIADITSKALIEDAGRRALRKHEKKIRGEMQQAKLAPFIQLASQYKNKRTRNGKIKTYLTMLTTKVFPKYHEFVAVNEHVKNFDILKLAALINLDLPAIVNSADEFQIAPIEYKFYKSRSTKIGLNMLIDESSSFQMDLSDDMLIEEMSLLNVYEQKVGKTKRVKASDGSMQ